MDGSGKPLTTPTQQPVIHLVTTPAQLLMQAIHDETAKLSTQPDTDETDTAQDAEQDTPAA